MSFFKKAEKKKVKLKIGLAGPSGAGKTYSALRLAQGINLASGGNKKIAVIDTESGSASLYSDRFNFDVLELNPPYTTEKYLRAMEEAIKAGYDILIMDSISHQWKGEGSVLNRKEQVDARGGNSFTNWSKFTPEQEKFVAKILHSNIDMIVTMRSKQEYILEANDKGKQAPRKVGLAPIQRDGMEYEFTAMFDIAINHTAEASKDRTSLFKERIFTIDESIGEELVNWRNSGVDYVHVEPPVEAPKQLTTQPFQQKQAAVATPPVVQKEVQHTEAVKVGPPDWDNPPGFDENEPFPEPPAALQEEFNEPPEEAVPNVLDPISAFQYRKLVDYVKNRGIPTDYVKTVLQAKFKGKEAKALTKQEYSKLMLILETGPQ